MQPNSVKKQQPANQIKDNKKTFPVKKKSNRTRYKYRSICKPVATKIPEYIWSAYNIPLPHPEFIFHSIRRWRIDYAWPEYLIAVEIEGGVFTKGRHIRPKGFIDDMEKYNAMAIMGWLLLRFTPRKINYELIRQVINQKRFKKV